MQAQILELERRVTQLDADPTSPVTTRAACAFCRDVLIPMLDAEIKGTAFWLVPVRWGKTWMRNWLQGFVDRTCGLA